MPVRFLVALTLASSLSVLSGCGITAADSDADAESHDSAESAYNETSSVLGRAATLAVARGASLALLTGKEENGGVGLTSSAAASIVAHRAGPDGTLGTADDGAFATISELEALSSVGKATIARLRAFALGLRVAGELPAVPEKTMTLEQLLKYEDGETVEDLCSARARYGISYDGGDGSFGTWAGTWRASISLVKNAAVAFTFVEGAGLTLSGDLELVIETESVSGAWHPYGPSHLSFPRIPTLKAYTHLEPAGAAHGFTTQSSPQPLAPLVHHDASFTIDVVDGAFAIHGTVQTRNGYGISGSGTANYYCRPMQ